MVRYISLLIKETDIGQKKENEQLTPLGEFTGSEIGAIIPTRVFLCWSTYNEIHNRLILQM